MLKKKLYPIAFYLGRYSPYNCSVWCLSKYLNLEIIFVLFKLVYIQTKQLLCGVDLRHRARKMAKSVIPDDAVWKNSFPNQLFQLKVDVRFQNAFSPELAEPFFPLISLPPPPPDSSVLIFIYLPSLNGSLCVCVNKHAVLLSCASGNAQQVLWIWLQEDPVYYFQILIGFKSNITVIRRANVKSEDRLSIFTTDCIDFFSCWFTISVQCLYLHFFNNFFIMHGYFGGPCSTNSTVPCEFGMLVCWLYLFLFVFIKNPK